MESGGGTRLEAGATAPALSRTEGAIVITFIRGTSGKGIGQDPGMTCREKPRFPESQGQRGVGEPR